MSRRYELVQELEHLANRLWAVEDISANQNKKIESLLKEALKVLSEGESD